MGEENLTNKRKGNPLENRLSIDAQKSNKLAREIMGEIGPLVYLIGKQCAYCGLIYETKEDIENHRPIGGYNNDIIGKECWKKYLKSKKQ